MQACLDVALYSLRGNAPEAQNCSRPLKTLPRLFPVAEVV